jgi:tRNA pseudouridine55 synthase
VVKKIRWNICRAFDIKKIKVGHAGTLDPKATGLLIVCTGKFTKKINEIQAQTKVYTGTMKLGATTPTFDTESEEDRIFPTEHINDDLLLQTTQQFLGEIQQHPPIHSAVKKDGKRLYELARAGEVVETEARTVRIDEFKITKIEMPFVDFEVQCGKGTYIRSLANDFGEALNSGAYLAGLRRTKIGDFSVVDADNSILEPEYFGLE